MSDKIKAYAAITKDEKLKPFEYEAGELGAEQVEIKVENCGICHSDLSIIKNDWGVSVYPVVPGHEVVGTIAAVGDHVKNRQVGQRVGLGWFAGSCMHCDNCMAGDHNLCRTGEATIVNRYGGFADRVRANWEWAIPLPAGVDAGSAGPLFCGGITVFNPFVQADVKPTDRIGVIGIGGLGHMALQFANKWGCEVTAFTSSDSKAEESKRLGAHNVVNSRDDAQMKKIAGSLDFIISTVNVPLNWQAYLDALNTKGHLHFVGAVLEPIAIGAMTLIGGQKTISGTGLGSPATTAKMLEFCARHDIKPVIEKFPMSEVNEALEHLEAGKARYRIVLQNDIA